jgi:hypothetical protein
VLIAVPRRLVGAALALALVALVSCQDERSENGALDTFGSAGTRARGLPVGAEGISFLAGFRNVSDAPVTIRRIEPILGAGFDEGVAEIGGLWLAPRGKALDVVLSTDYGTLPPVWKARPRSPCRVQKLSAVEGYVVEPDEPATIAVMYRTLNPGRFSIAGERVVYEQDGEVHEQVVRFVIAGIVKADARPGPLGDDVAPCAHLARVLPGWRDPK